MKVKLSNFVLDVDVDNESITFTPTKLLTDKFNFTRKDKILLADKLEKPIKTIWNNFAEVSNSNYEKKGSRSMKSKARSQTAHA